ncbi:MAG: M16 family metallopeptidase [Cetobacterium sp.]
MHFKKIYFLLIFIFYSVFIFSENLKDSPNLIEGSLKNGLHYYILKNEKPENRATLNLVVKSGSLNENDDQQGLAHLLEHMAFNGTTKYKKNDLIKYLQSLGLDFGGDLNAYTSFGETVYKLQIPTSSEDLNKGIEVLREWASEITLDPKAIDDEKSVVLEEWRLRQGLVQRIGDLQKKAIFGNSRYFYRFPIGTPEHIKNASSKLLKDYYIKWYTPKNMAVIAVGDFNPTEVENIIKKYFDYTTPDTFTERPVYKVGDNFKKSTTVFTDPELTGVSLDFITHGANFPINTMENLKKYLTLELLNGIINTQISIMAKEPNTPIIAGESYSYNIGNYDRFYGVSLNLREDNILAGIKNSYSLIKYFATNKISNDSLNLEKEDYINTLKNFVINEKSITNNTYVDMIKDRYLLGDTFLNPQKELELTESLISKITPTDIENAAKTLYNPNLVVFLTAPKKDNLIVPSSEEINKLINEIRNSKENSLNIISQSPILEKPNLTKGNIVSTKNEKDYTIFTLSNGIEVYFKNTNFDKDKIYIRLFKEEGSSTDDYNNYLNSLLASYLVSNSSVGNISTDNMDVFMKGKNFSVTPYINDYEQGFLINSNLKDLDTSLDFFRLMISNPQIDKTLFTNIIAQLKDDVKNRKNSPKALYKDKISEVISQNNPRRKPLSIEDLDKINSSSTLNIFKEKFSNFNNYKLILVGSLSKEEAIDKINKYFSSLPSKVENKTAISLDIKHPKNILKEEVTKGIDKKSTVTLIYPYEGTYSNNDRIMYTASAKILDMILIEEIREKLGGVYSIYSIPNLESYNYGENDLRILFSTKVDRTEEITEATKKVVNDFVNGKISKRKIDDIIKNYQLTYETSMKKNQFWFQYLYKKSFVPNYEILTPNQYTSFINYENMVKFLKEAINTNNYIQITLLPEGED